MFDRAFVINLPFKYDRLMKFQNSYPACLPPCEVWPAVHGDSVRHPDWWHSGSGAWGCYRSHMQILEYCYQQKDKIQSYIVFEDDAIFRPDFEDRLAEFMGSLPNDWEQIYLGGQLLHEDQFPPEKINHHVFFPKNVNRTHCFAVHQRGYERLYKHLNAVPFASQDHIDHHLGRLHDTGTLRLYVPPKWLVGQDGGPSNISGNNNSATFWADPETKATNLRIADAVRAIPTVFLESTLEVALELERRGWHRGHWQDEQRLDRGVCNAIAGTNMNFDLQNWEKCVLPEAVREGKTCACLFHPSLTWDQVQAVGFNKITRIVANDVADAERQLIAIDAPSRSTVKEPRNLIYFIWPKLGNGEWEWNVEELLKRIDQFDGARSIAVATGEGAAQLVDVQRAFDGIRIDRWLEFPNDPNLGEVVAFPSLLKTLQHESGYTFYAHAKGVSYDDHRTREWTSMMYEVCLDDQEYVDESLKQFPCAGPFTIVGQWKCANANGWYYSGAFYWFRNADVKEKPNWLEVATDHRWHAELYLGNHFTSEQAGVLFGPNVGYLYEDHEIARMRQWMSDWREQGRKKKEAA